MSLGRFTQRYLLPLRIALGKVWSYRRTGPCNALRLTALMLRWPRRPVRLRHPHHASRLYLRPRTTDRIVFEDVMLRGYYDWPIPVAPRFIVDAGANIGMATRWFAERFPQATLLAVEPESGNYKQLVSNVAEYGTRVRTCQAGLWWRPAALAVQRSHQCWSGAWDFTVTECPPQAPDAVRAVTMNEILATAPGGWIDLLKMDVEGSEWVLFANDSATWLARTRLLIVELHPRPDGDPLAIATAALAPYLIPAGRVGEAHVFVNPHAPA